MKRRSFLAALFAAPMVPVVARAIEATPHIDATPFEVIDGADRLPLVFEEGVLKLQVANVNEVTAGTVHIRGDKGNMVLDLTNGCMTFNG